MPEVGPGSLGDLQSTGLFLHGGDTAELINLTLTALAGNVEVGIRIGLLDITCNIEGVSRSFGDGETVPQGNETGEGTHSNDDTPHLIDGQSTVAGAFGGIGSGLEGSLEASSADQSDQSGSELSKTLHSEDSVHHGTSPFGSSEFRSDDGGQGVIASNSNTLWLRLVLPSSAFSPVLPGCHFETYHDHTPEDDETNDRDGWGSRSQGLSECSEDDENEFESVHALATHTIGEVTKEELTENGSTGSGDLDGSIGVGRNGSLGLGVLEEDDTQHSIYQVDSEDLVRRVSVSWARYTLCCVIFCRSFSVWLPAADFHS